MTLALSHLRVYFTRVHTPVIWQQPLHHFRNLAFGFRVPFFAIKYSRRKEFVAFVSLPIRWRCDSYVLRVEDKVGFGNEPTLKILEFFGQLFQNKYS